MSTEQDGMLSGATFLHNPRSTESQGFRRRWSNVVTLAGTREADKAESLSRLPGTPKLETICSEPDWEKCALSGKEVRLGRRKGMTGEKEIKKPDVSIYHGKSYRDMTKFMIF